MKNATSPIDKTPAEILKAIIKALGTDAAKFSREIGNDRPDNIYKVTEGKVSPSWDTLIKIATRYRNLNADFLLRGVGPVLSESEEYTPLTPDDKDRMIEYLKGENAFLREIITKRPHP